jgi:DNA-binding GntR family transcriptional regulator
VTAAPTAQEETLARLRDDLVTGQLPPGGQVLQESLALRYGVSRVPLREALKVLEGEGHLVHHRHRGYFVAELSVADLVEVYRLRELLEAEAIRLAVPRLSDDDLRGLEAAALEVRTCGDKGDLVAMAEANRQFHFLLFDRSGSPRLVRLLRQLWDATDIYRRLYFAQRANRKRINDDHDDLLGAVRQRQVQTAIEIQSAHRQQSLVTVRALIESHIL